MSVLTLPITEVKQSLQSEEKTK